MLSQHARCVAPARRDVHVPNTHATTLSHRQSASDAVKTLTAARHAVVELKKEEVPGTERPEAACLTNLGTAYSKLGEGTKALEVMARALEMKKSIGTPLEVGTTAINMAGLHRQNSDNDGALAMYEEALASVEEAEKEGGGNVELKKVALVNLHNMCEFELPVMTFNENDGGGNAAAAAREGGPTELAKEQLANYARAATYRGKLGQIAKAIGRSDPGVSQGLACTPPAALTAPAHGPRPRSRPPPLAARPPAKRTHPPQRNATHRQRNASAIVRYAGM